MHGTLDVRCLQCGTAFKPKRRSAKYCSPACRQAVYRSAEGRTGLSSRTIVSAEGVALASPEEGFPRRITYYVAAGPEVHPLALVDPIFDQHDLDIRNPKQPEPPKEAETRYAREATEAWVASMRSI